KGWRLFDVAINDKIILKDLDIWKEVGHAAALKKTVIAKISGGQLVVSFPHVASGQAVISAIAIASRNKNLRPARPAPSLIQNLVVNNRAEIKFWSVNEWLNTGDLQYSNNKTSFASLPPVLYGAEWIRTPALTYSTS